MRIAEENIREEIIRKTSCLFVSVKELSSRIPEEDIYKLRERLIDSVSNVPLKIESGLQSKQKMQQVINLIKANSALNELKGYLNLVNELNYCNTQTLIDDIDYVTNILMEEHPYLNMAIKDI